VRRIRLEGRCTTTTLRGVLSVSQRVAQREEGQTMTEYAFVLSLVAAASAAAFTVFGQEIVNLLGPVAKALTP
jgi:Flp pilus assembly pilin Flp